MSILYNALITGVAAVSSCCVSLMRFFSAANDAFSSAPSGRRRSQQRSAPERADPLLTPPPPAWCGIGHLKKRSFRPGHKRACMTTPRQARSFCVECKCIASSARRGTATLDDDQAQSIHRISIKSIKSNIAHSFIGSCTKMRRRLQEIVSPFLHGLAACTRQNTTREELDDDASGSSTLFYSLTGQRTSMRGLI